MIVLIIYLNYGDLFQKAIKSSKINESGFILQRFFDLSVAPTYVDTEVGGKYLVYVMIIGIKQLSIYSP